MWRVTMANYGSLINWVVRKKRSPIFNLHIRPHEIGLVHGTGSNQSRAYLESYHV